MTRLLFAVLFVAACSSGGKLANESSSVIGSDVDLGPTPITGSIACGASTCSASQLCVQSCCRNDCYARPSGGCHANDQEIWSCNGVAKGCMCFGTDCPAPPTCDHTPDPLCADASGPEACEGLGFSCTTGGSCDPNNRVATCNCGS